MEGLLDGTTMEPVPTSPVKNGGMRVGNEGRSASGKARWRAPVGGNSPTRHNPPLSAHHHHLRSAMEGLLDGMTMEPPVPTCPVCKRTFREASALSNHVKVHSRKLRCDVCFKTFARNYTLKRHMETHSQQVMPCPYCNKTFTSRDTLRRHKQLHSRRIGFDCWMCGCLFARKDYLTKHMLTHTVKFDYKCTRCDKAYRTKHELNRHIRAHKAFESNAAGV